MTIPFSQVPANLRIPLFFAELDNSKANSGIAPQRTLIVGQKLVGSSITTGVAQLLQGIPWIKAQAGNGSHLADMCEWYRKRDSFGEVWVLPVGPAGGSVAATGTVVFTGPATADGTISLYIGGDLVTTAVASGASATTIAASVKSACDALPDLAVTTSASTGTLTLTAKNAGLIGNDIDLRLNYKGAAAGEVLPAGVGATITAMAGGTTNPAGSTLDTNLSALGDRSFDIVVWGWSDATTLDSLKTWLATQWDPLHMYFGGAFAGYRGSLAGATTLGASRNDPHTSIMPCFDSPTPPWCWAANVAGAAAPSLRADPGLPLQTLPLDVQAPPVGSRFKKGERNTLLWSGMSSHTWDDDGTGRLETVITTYQKNASGVADDSYLYVETLYTLAAVIRDLQGFVTSTFSRSKLADDGTTFRPGNAIVTPSIIRNALIGRYRRLERDGLVQNSDLFAEALVVQRNGNSSCRVDGLLPVVPIDALRQVAVLVQFRRSAETL